MRRLAKLLPYLAVLSLVLIAAVAFLRSGPITKHLRVAITNELARQTGRKVSIRQVSVGLTGSVTLDDLEMRDRDGSPLLRCPKATVWVGGLMTWLRHQASGLEVERIRLSGAEVTITRDPSGDLNVADLMKRKPAAKPFRGTLSVEQGTVVFVDQARGGARTTLADASFSMRPEGDAGYSFRLRAEGAEGAFDSLSASGQADGSGGMKASGSVNGLDLAYAMERLPEVKALTISAGRGDLKGKLEMAPRAAPGDRLTYEVELNATGAEVSFPWLRRPVKGVEGRLRFANGDLELKQAKGMVAEAPVEVSGTISNLPKAELALDITASGIRVKQVEELLPNIFVPPALLLPAPVRIEARAEGPASEVVVSGRAAVRVIKFHLVPWNDVVTKFQYSHGHLAVTGLSAHGSPRRLEADMSLSWGKGERQAKASLRLTRVPMDTLAQMMGLKATPLKGVATVEGEMSLSGLSPELSGRATIEDAVWGELPVGRVRLRFRYADNKLELREGEFTGPSGRGSFSGDVTIGHGYQVKAKAQSVPVGAVAGALGLPGLSPNPFELASATVQVTDRRLSVSDLRLSGGGAEGRGHLEVRDWRAKVGGGLLSGQLDVAGVPISKCLPAGWGGSVGDALAEGTVVLGGTRTVPTAKVDLALKLPVVSGVNLEVGEAHLRYQQGQLYVDEVSLADGRSRARLTGEYRPKSGFDMDLVGDPVDVATLSAEARRRWGLALAGRAKVEAHIAGPAKDPEVSFRAGSEDLTINDQHVDEVWLEGRFAHGDVRVDQGELIAGESRVTVSGKVGVKSGELGLDWHLANLDLLKLQTIAYSAAWRLYKSGAQVPHRELYALIPRPLEGRLSAEGTISGFLASPEVTAHLRLSPVSFAGRDVEVICGSISGSPDRIEVDLDGFHETAHASLNGFVEPQGKISLSADIGNLDLRLLEPWLQWGVALGGEGTINFDISGKTAGPVLLGDIHVANLRLGPVQVESAEAVPIRLDSQGTLTVDGILVRDHEMEGYGNATIPMRMPGQGNGATEGVAATGELHVRNGEFPPIPGMPTATYNADLQLDGDRILLTSSDPQQPEQPGLRGMSGEGKFWVSGGIEVKALRPSGWAQNRFDLSAELHAAEVSVPGMGRGRLDGKVELKNDPGTGRPTLGTPDGQPMVLSQAEISLPLAKGRPPWQSTLPFSPDLRVRVVTGEGVWVRRGARDRPTQIQVDPARHVPGVEAGASEPEASTGYLDIGGALRPGAVTLDGRFESTRGVLVFPNGVLTLRRGTASIQQKAGEKTPRVSVQAEANGRVGDYYVSVNPEGQVYPPASSYDGTGELVSSPFRWNANSLPHLEEGYILALLGGSVAEPTAGGGQDLSSLLAGPGGEQTPGQITGFVLPSLGGAFGVQEFSLDLALKKPVRLRIGERLFSRVTVSYVSELGDPAGSRTLRINYDVKPRVAIGWSVDESERTLWEIQSFVPF